MDLIPQPHLDVLALANNPDIGLTKSTKKIHGRSSLLAHSELKRVLLAALLYGLLNIIGYTEKAVGRTGPADPLVRALVVVVADPVVEALAGVGERGEHRLLQELLPDRFPEPLDLAQGHGVLGGRAHVADPLAL